MVGKLVSNLTVMMFHCS